MPTTQELLLRLDATTEGLRRELQRADQSVSQFAGNTERRLAGIDSSFKKLGAGLSKVHAALGPLNSALGIFGASLGIGAVVSFGQSVLQMADDLQDSAAQLGISTSALQVYQYAALQNGIANEKLQLALQTLNRTIGEAASGSKTAQDKFKGLGIAFTDAAGNARGASDVLRDLADLIQAIPDPALRAAAAAELLGAKAGPQLVPLLAAGSQGLADFATSAANAGQVLSQETVKRLADANQQLENFGNRMRIVAGEVVGFLLDAADRDEQYGLARQLERTVGRIDDVRQHIAELKASVGDGVFDYLDQSELDEAEQKLKELIALRNELSGKIGSRPQGHSGRGAKTPSAAPSVTISTGSGGSGGETDAERAAKKLSAALHDLNMEVDALTGGDRADRLAKWLDRAGVTADSDAGRNIAALVDKLQAADDQTKALAISKKEAEEADRAWNQELARGQAIMESVQTPLEAYTAQIAELQKHLANLTIDQVTFDRATGAAAATYAASLKAADDATSTIQDGLREGTQAIGTAFEDAALEAQKLRDVAQALGQDIGRILLRLAFTKPLEGFLGNIVGDFLSNDGGVGAAVDTMISSNPDLFAGGGIMTSRGPVPLRRYSGGGIANSPQLAMFGEGSTPEAYVPVPNGRIPVDLRGAGGGGVVIHNQVTVQASGGSREQNADLARQVDRAVRRSLDDVVDARLIHNKRGGGILNPMQVG